jgi:WD40 repeat protein
VEQIQWLRSSMKDDQKNPYVGPRTFLKEEGHLFFGRDREARDLLSLVASEQLVLFYAQSGAGKSSLINTRLIPGLEGKKFQVLRVGRVGGDRSPGIDVQNIYVFNLIRSLVQREINPAILAKLSLSEFLARLNATEGEYFYRDTQPETRENTRRALIIDQFEEVFNTHAESWEQRGDFFRQLAQAMEDDPYLWVVMVMREDYIAALDPYAHLLPGGLRTRYYMQRLSRESAIKAVRKPVENIRPFEEGVAEKLVEDLSSIKVQKPDGTQEFEPGQYIEPVQLQVVCYGLWQNLPMEGTQITEKDLLEVGDVDEALGKYYAGRIAAVATNKNVKERLIRDWIEKKLIAPGGIRSMVMRDTSRKSRGIRDDVIQALQSDLVRAENRGGTIWYELTHDRLVAPILESNKKWFDENLSPLQRQAALWKEQGQNETWLFSDQALVDVQEWAKAHQDELTDVETEFLEECQAKQKEKEQRYELDAQQQKLIAEQKLTRQRRIIANVSIIATIVTLAFAVFGFVQAGRAKDAQAVAERNLGQAQTAQANAILSQNLANANAATAVANEQEAERQAKILFSNSLSEQSNALRDENFQVSMLLGIEAYRRIATVQTLGTLLNIAQANPRLSQILTQHSDVVSSIAFSPDGKILASGSQDKTIVLWDAETQKPIGKLTSSPVAITKIAFSPDGKTLASIGYDKTIILWDVASRLPIDPPLEGHSNVVSAVAFSPDGKILASGSYDSTILLWDMKTLQSIGRLTGHSNAISSLAFSPNGNTLVSSSYDNTVVWWDVQNMRPMSRFTGLTGAVSSTAFSPDGRFLASGSCSKLAQDKCTEGEIMLWDTAIQQPIGEALIGHTDFVTSVAFSPDGKTLASGSNDNTILLWDVASGKPIGEPLTGHSDIVTSVAFSRDGQTLASGSYDRTIILWNVARQPIGQTLIKNADAVGSIAFSPNGEILASGSCSIRTADKCSEGQIMFWDAGTHQSSGQPLKGHTDFVSSVAFSPDGKTLASGSYDNTILLWDIEIRKPIGQPLTGHTDIVTSVAFSPDGKTLASASYDKTIILWDIESHKPVGQPLTGHADAVTSVVFSPDGKTLASASYDKTIILWDIESRKLIGQPLTGHSNAVSSLAFSPDGKTLASGSYDNTILLWDMETRQSIGQFTGHSNSISSVAFSPTGETLASSGYDNLIFLWDVASRLPIGQPLQGHSNVVSSVTFSPDGKTLASGGYDNNIILWDIDPESLMEKSCQRASRNLTRAEWQRYFPAEDYRKICEQWPLEPAVTSTPVGTQVPRSTVTATATKLPDVIAPTAIANATPTVAPEGTAVALFRVVNVTEEDRLNIRAGPGLKYDVIGKIPKDGRDIRITGPGVQGDNTIWVPIIYKGISGWVNSFFLSKQ